MAVREPRQTWLVLVHQLPPTPSGLRVKVWRKLQQIGAIAVKNSVYLLPDTPDGVEDFQWLHQEIEDTGGSAIVFRASAMDAPTDSDIVLLFQEARNKDYEEITVAFRQLEARIKTPWPDDQEGDHREQAIELQKLYRRLEEIVAIDFFDTPKRAEAQAMYRQCRSALDSLRGSLRPMEEPLPGPPVRVDDPGVFRHRQWVTRTRPHIDRLASAWLIKKFIDPDAVFLFVDEGTPLQEAWVPFDMYNAVFSHHGEDCTCETLIAAFQLREPALREITEIVHDADLKDGKFNRPEVAGVEQVLRGMIAHLSDDEAIEAGLRLFDGLYVAFNNKETSTRRGGRRERG